MAEKDLKQVKALFLEVVHSFIELLPTIFMHCDEFVFDAGI